MAAGETGFDDVSFDLISVQYHSLKAGHDYGQYVRDAKNANRDDIASFFEQVQSEDSDRARRRHEFLQELSGSYASGSAPNSLIRPRGRPVGARRRASLIDRNCFRPAGYSSAIWLSSHTFSRTLEAIQG